VVSILCHGVLNKRGLIAGSPLASNRSLDTMPYSADNSITVSEIPVPVPITAIEMLTTLSLLVGGIITAMGFLRFGSFSRLLSTPLVSAFTCAAALHVACAQLPPIFGISVAQLSGPFSLPLVRIQMSR
jgi:SulP family sulfate permease